MEEHRAGGKWAILRNDLGWPVASALARPAGAVGAPGSLWTFSGIRIILWKRAAFAAGWLEEIEAASGCACRMLICEGDDWKLREARTLGFERAEGGGGTADVNGRKVPLLSLRSDRGSASG